MRSTSSSRSAPLRSPEASTAAKSARVRRTDARRAASGPPSARWRDKRAQSKARHAAGRSSYAAQVREPPSSTSAGQGCSMARSLGKTRRRCLRAAATSDGSRGTRPNSEPSQQRPHAWHRVWSSVSRTRRQYHEARGSTRPCEGATVRPRFRRGWSGPRRPSRRRCRGTARGRRTPARAAFPGSARDRWSPEDGLSARRLGWS